MKTQKEMAEAIKKEIQETQKGRIELGVIEEARTQFELERKVAEAATKEMLAEKGYIISVPDTEVVLYEDEGYQLLYCNNIDSPGKIIFLMALKQAVRKVSGRTPITSSGYVAVPMPRDQFNLILASHQRVTKALKAYKERIVELEKEIAPLRYIEHLINEYKIDTKK